MFRLCATMHDGVWHGVWGTSRPACVLHWLCVSGGVTLHTASVCVCVVLTGTCLLCKSRKLHGLGVCVNFTEGISGMVLRSGL